GIKRPCGVWPSIASCARTALCVRLSTCLCVAAQAPSGQAQPGESSEVFRGVSPALAVFRLSWKWRERPTVKITERTLEKRTEVLHRGREGRHPEAAFAGTTAGLEAM